MRALTMVARVEAYLRARRQFGFQLRIEGGELQRFARYADALPHRGPVTSELAIRWAQDTDGTALYRARRLEVVRCFAKYQIAFEPKTEIPAAGVLGRAHRRTAPYIFSSSEIVRLVNAARSLPSPRGLRSETYASLIGLIACTGLRISEALRLRCVDSDFRAGVLSIRESKFRKSRLVPLHPSAHTQLRRYFDRRSAIAPPDTTSTLFISESGSALPYRTVHGVVRTLIDQVVTDIRDRRPRLHDLRHTFACRRLMQWYRDGADVNQRVAALSSIDLSWACEGFGYLLVSDRSSRAHGARRRSVSPVRARREVGMTAEVVRVGPLLQDYFCQRLIAQRDASRATVASYRDTFRLLLKHAQEQFHRRPTDLALADIDAPFILGFLKHLSEIDETPHVREMLASLRFDHSCTSPR